MIWYLTNSVNIILNIELLFNSLFGDSNYIFQLVFCYTEIQLSICYLTGGESGRNRKGLDKGGHPLSLLEAHKENTSFRL